MVLLSSSYRRCSLRVKGEASVIQITPVFSKELLGEHYSSITPQQWFANGITVHFKANVHKSDIFLICHPHPALESGVLFQYQTKQKVENQELRAAAHLKLGLIAQFNFDTFKLLVETEEYKTKQQKAFAEKSFERSCIGRNQWIQVECFRLQNSMGNAHVAV